MNHLTNLRPASLPGLPVRRAAWMAAALAALAALPLPSWALYKVVGPDGSISYSDRPPADGKAVAIKSNGSSASTQSLPYELAQIAQRFPVTLYTAKSCGAPCDNARVLLTQRGVPYQEYTVDTAADSAALQKQEDSTTLPAAHIGQQHLTGFSETEWSSYLNAAGYPKQSALPPNYTQPAPKPLAGEPAIPVPVPQTEAVSKPKAPPAVAPVTVPDNGMPAPSGFKF